MTMTIINTKQNQQKFRYLTLRIGFISMLGFALTGCGSDSDSGLSSGISTPTIPVFEDTHLQQGRNTWVQVCRNCHLLGVVGAPRIGDTEDWSYRARQGRSELHQHAINGIKKDGNWTMPPRGGEKRLSDTQVRQAVDFMLAASLDETQIAAEGEVIKE